MKKWIAFIISSVLFFVWYFKQNIPIFVDVESLDQDDDAVGIGATGDSRSGGQEGEEKEEEEQEEEGDKCVYSSSEFRCIANNGAEIGDPVCCGQSGEIRTTKYNCPVSLPYCKGYKCGEKWGLCEKNK